MGIFNIFKSEKRTKQVENYTLPTFSDALTFGQILAQNQAMNISAVYRAVEIISDSIAMLPIKVKITDKQHKEEIPDHPLYMAFENNLISKFTMMKLLISSVMLKGNGYAYIERAGDGTVTGIRFLESGSVTINYNKLKRILYYQCTEIKGKIEPCNMIHLIKNTNDGVTGISVLTYARRSLNLANSTENQASNFFTNGCNLSGILTVQGQLSSQQRNDIRTSWNQAYANGGNGLAVLQGNMNYQPVSLSASDSQMLESRIFNVQDIARFFGISPILLGDLTHSSFSTLEAVQNQFLLHTLQPYIVMIEQEFNRKLLKPSESNLEINLDETYLLKTDKTAQASYYSTMIDKGIMCINEVRKELGYSNIEGGDKHLIAYTDINQNTINSQESNNTQTENKTENKTENTEE